MYCCYTYNTHKLVVFKFAAKLVHTIHGFNVGRASAVACCQLLFSFVELFKYAGVTSYLIHFFLFSMCVSPYALMNGPGSFVVVIAVAWYSSTFRIYFAT